MGSNALFSDQTGSLIGQALGTAYTKPAEFALNLVDWSLEDQGLLSIRSRGHFARTLKPLEDEAKLFWEVGNYVLALLGLLIVFLVANAQNQVFLPANVSLDNAVLAGSDLLLIQPDGSVITIQNSALNVPTFILDNVEIPQETLVAALGESGINIAAGRDRSLVIVVNDNGRSYTPTIGGLATALSSLRTDPRYEHVLDAVKKRLNAVPGVGPAAYDALHAMKKGLKDALAPQGLFEDLGLKYVGPVDGHDRAAMETALTQAKRFGGPVIVHALTRKGYGYDPAERHEADQFHAPGPFDVQTGAEKPKGRIWTDHFSEAMVDLGHRRKDVVAITAAMMHPVGLDAFERHFPERTFDVGIAEQHAATSAAGLAMGGLHPVVAVYATFLNRAFDQVLMDCALHRCGVTFVLDRSGVTGDDGASHNGMWDMSILQVVPGLRLAAPRDTTRLRELLDEAVLVDDAPTVVRFPKGAPPADIEAVDRVGGCDVLVRSGAKDVLVVAVGSMATTAVDVAERLTAQGIGVTVVDPRWVKPVDPALVDLAREHRLVVSVEDNGVQGGCGASLLQALVAADVRTPVRLHGIPQEFLGHAKRDVILDRVGLTAQHLARGIVEAMADESLPDLDAVDRRG